MYNFDLRSSVHYFKGLGIKDGVYYYGMSDTFDSEIKEMASLGFKGVEIAFVGPYSANAFDSIEDAFITLDKYGIKKFTVHMPLNVPWIDFATSYEPDRIEICKWIIKQFNYIDKFSPDAYVFHAGANHIKDSDYKEYSKYLVDGLKMLVGGTENNVCLENLSNNALTDTSDKIVDILDRVDGLKTCVDLNHFFKERPEHAIPKYKGRVGNVHVSDYNFDKEGHLMPFDGSNDWKAILKAFEDIGYTGPFTYELRMGNKYTYKDIAENHKKLIEFYNK